MGRRARQARPLRHARPDRRADRQRRTPPGCRDRPPEPKRARPSRPGLLSQQRSGACRQAGRLSGLSRAAADAGRRTECRGARGRRRRLRARHRPGPVDPRAESRRGRDLQSLGRGRFRHQRAGLRLGRLLPRIGIRRPARAARRPADRLHRHGPDHRRRAAGRAQRLSAAARHRPDGALPFAEFRRCEFRLPRHCAQRHPAERGPLEARRRARHANDPGRRQPHLCRALFPTRDQGGGGRAGPQRDRRDGPPSPESRLDGAGDSGARPRQAARIHAEDRLSELLARLFVDPDQPHEPGPERAQRRRMGL